MLDFDDALVDEAKKVLYGNLRIGYSKWAKSEYKYVSPSYPHYPHQWFWDSCFHAIALSHIDIDLAKNEIRSLLKAQRKNGFMPHVIYWGATKFRRPLAGIGAMLESKFSLFPKTTDMIQPPLIAQSVERIYQEEKDLDFLLEVVPKLIRYYRWLAEFRDPDGDGLISVISPYESGLDQSPSYDVILGVKNGNALFSALKGRTVTLRNLMRNYNLQKIFADDYFTVEDVFVNSIYILNLKIMSDLTNKIDREEDSRFFGKKYNLAKRSLVDKCFDKKKKFFFDIYSKNEKVANVVTIKGLMPIILDIDKKIVASLVNQHLLETREFNLPYPIPTVARNEKSFLPTPPTIAHEPIIWRGPSWVNTNWYIQKGLRRHGYEDLADKIVDKTVAFIRKSGFREFFNPFNGRGYGEHHFGWSTLIIDMMVDKNSRKEK